DVIVVRETTRVSYEEEYDPNDLADANARTGVIDIAAAPVSRQLSGTGRKSKLSRWLWITVATAAALAMVVGAFLWRQSLRVAFENVRLAKFTTTGKAVKVPVSPDGKYVAFVLNDAGQQSVWLR